MNQPVQLEKKGSEEYPGSLNSAITAVCVGLLAGFAGTMYHVYIWYIQPNFYLPVGALLALLLVYVATTWVSLRAGKNWAGTLAGGLAFLLVLFFAFSREGSVLVLINPQVPVGVAGTIWVLGILAATVVSNVTVNRYLNRRS